MFPLRSAADDYSTAAAFGASWLVHGLLVAAAWMMYVQVDDVREDAPLLSALIADDDAPAAIEHLANEVELSVDPSTGSSLDSIQFELTPLPLDAPRLDVPNSKQLVSQFDEWGGVNWADQVSEGDATRLGTGVGNALGDGTGHGKFFGLEAEGSTFVFVVDSSGSMRHPYPAPARNRFNRVKMELVRTIGEMSADQKFFIIFFNSEMLPMPANHLIPAEPIYQQQYLNWMAQVPVGGDTEPEDALMLALYLQPDVIYFLTDGAFAYRVTESVRRTNQRRVPIHTIGFGDNEGEEWLLKIAEESGGAYQFITQDNDPLLQPGDDVE